MAIAKAIVNNVEYVFDINCETISQFDSKMIEIVEKYEVRVRNQIKKKLQSYRDTLIKDKLEFGTPKGRETYQDNFQKFHYEVTEHDGGVLGYRRI